MKRFISEIFQDMDGAYSMKRAVFFLFALVFLLLILLTIALMVLAAHTAPALLSFVQTALDRIKELLLWIGGFILAEQGTKFAPKAKDGGTP